MMKHNDSAMRPPHRVHPGSILTALLAAGLALGSTGVTAGEKKICSKTTRLAYSACHKDVRDNYWIETGICLNLSDPEERADCNADAKETLREENTLCKEQRAARGEVCMALGEGPYDPQIDPLDFVNPADIGDTIAPNTYFPLVRGVTRIYEAGDEIITVTVTDETVGILGVTCAVVHDVAEVDGEVIEDTIDWYAQDIYGNVWYFGEIAKNFEDGKLHDLDGSWEAGLDGSKAGILMPAIPAVGDVYRQEWALAEAEDIAEVLSTTASETAPAASCSGDCVLTHDFTPIEPDASESKFYAPGVGVIVELDDHDPTTRVELVDIIGP
jgi:hypothetical protein